MDRLSLLLVIIGAINWGLIGLFQFDLVAFLFGGQAALISRVLYTIIGAAGVWSISMLFTTVGNMRMTTLLIRRIYLFFCILPNCIRTVTCTV